MHSVIAKNNEKHRRNNSTDALWFVKDLLVSEMKEQKCWGGTESALWLKRYIERLERIAINSAGKVMYVWMVIGFFFAFAL